MPAQEGSHNPQPGIKKAGCPVAKEKGIGENGEKGPRVSSHGIKPRKKVSELSRIASGSLPDEKFPTHSPPSSGALCPSREGSEPLGCGKKKRAR